MKWIQIDSFLIQPTKEGVPVITIPLLDGTAFQPYMIYNGGSRALLFKNKKTGVVLDRINLGIRKWLNSAKEAAICEINPLANNMIPLYRVSIIHVDQKSDINMK
ncbi:MAG: hypothetical protein II942_03085 [Alphaproteobacteria bacterium]|nr:hypothetical protein [Alphaproteobacteria bacterium]